MGAVFFWIIIGLIAGAVANRVFDSSGGLFGNLILGLVGALVGGYIANLLRLNVTGGWIDSIVVASCGAILLLFLKRKVF
ncbi:GlsB/YeaQ/YmgE family stress response membrane protein [Rhodobacteraceae bacterium RKSG542]|uniref:GlsB/YeaQ/YmgE family stress response membrane protein n=1 Tax=Pseudovibrio flavus TaxID=2529854 RepID=UPI0012BCE631|nr:GlsB/YeaQ/YmgE family stress response membrane protein [Pseudovibrio flavus]MTI16092.1 GlsB/YeaQ/YmgE family stress response membrane protein [Pseudovibrio flavus]